MRCILIQHLATFIPYLATEDMKRKGYFSMAIDVLVSHQLCFFDTNVGWSGKITHRIVAY